ncbi:(2Fe-2S)-binding protein [Fictibacillus sp. Mic-4]|uniref:(2Fe-2S)-binding protein n=1 Tax=Fictibacillus sp. Mic-4 TaxID=3132826 RepID=UPI003CEFFFF4
MTDRRILHHPVLGTMPERNTVHFTFDGKTYKGFEGETIAAALLASGVRTLRVHEEIGTPRGIYCNIGHCFECRVTVNGQPGVRSCLTEIKDGMVIESGKRQPTPLKRKEAARHV